MTYDFRHMLNFTTDMKKFTKALLDSSITANLDNADGGFDALMQVLICGDRIGWNPKSRKVVLIATDSLPHFSGDGKLGKIISYVLSFLEGSEVFLFGCDLTALK